MPITDTEKSICNPILQRAAQDFENQRNASSAVIHNITHYLAISTIPHTENERTTTGFDDSYEKYISKHIENEELEKITRDICCHVSSSSQHEDSVFTKHKHSLR